jgi:hypothetical protein
MATREEIIETIHAFLEGKITPEEANTGQEKNTQEQLVVKIHLLL